MIFSFYVYTLFIIPVTLYADFTTQNESSPKKAIIDGVEQFESNLLQIISETIKPENNILISPFNIYSALAITYLGAAGDTRNELEQLLGIPRNGNETSIHQALSAIIQRLEVKLDKYSTFTETSFANNLFVQNGFKIKDSFVQNVRTYYKAEPQNLDFAHKPQEATDTINKWISKKTKDRIPQLFKSPIDPSTNIVLTSALYFFGKWSEAFPEYKTKKDKFTTAENKEIKVDLMNNVQRVPYIADSILRYEAIRLPYERNEFEMIIVLPKNEQTLKNLSSQLKNEHLRRLFDDQGTEGLDNGVSYKIPRMKFSWSNSIKDSLKKAGLRSLFGQADLTNMIVEGSLKVSDVNHAAEIEVDEKGTKASAITGIKFVPYMSPIVPQAPKSFVVNKPFLMMIYNRPSQILLFYAYVNNPLPSQH